MLSLSIPSLREDHNRHREQIREQFFSDHNAGRALADLTREVDLLVRHVAARCLGQAEIAVLAIGGYGRRELHPFSDVDLLFIHRSGESQAEAVITAMLHDLWDLKLHLGHQVWSLEQLEKLTLEELEFVLALLDARVMAGNDSLGREFLDKIFHAFVDSHRKELVEKIIQLTEERHASYRDTIYQLEPELKQSPGGLRDYLVGRWLLQLERPGAFFPYTEAEIHNAYEFISMLRVFVHFLVKRNQNRLTHRLQEEVSRHLGHQQATAKSGVESLMKEYFLNARVLNGFCRKVLRDKKNIQPAGEIDLAATQLESMEAILAIFRRSLAENRPLSDRTRTVVLESLPRFSQNLNFPVLRPLVQEIFKPRPGLYQGLTEMYQLGLLELLFPEFGSIKARVIRDFYHKYTVDEHTLLAIKNIEDLAQAVDQSDLRFRSLLAEVTEPELLTLSLLLHDVGKSREGKHVGRSARLAASALRRFRFSKEGIDTVVFLIRNHLAMSTVMFRRDVEDEEEIQRFADLVNDTTHLRLLCLLTFADIKAVAPGTLNEWKKDLLWQLYVSAYHQLTFGYGEERIEEEDIGEKLLAGLPAELDGEAFEKFLEGFPRRYLLATPPDEIYQHYRMASKLDSERPVQLRLSHRGSHYQLCVVTPDRYFLFAKIVGVLSYFDMNILRGYGFSNRQNTILDFFQFDDMRNVFHLNPEEKERFKQLLTRAVKDEISVERLLEGKEKSVVFRPLGTPFEPSLYFEDEPGNYTIMEIVAPDSIGLLYRIGREISGLRCNIELVLINTEGDRAVDVFYLTHDGKKLSVELQQQLSKRIIQSVTLSARNP